MNYLNNTIKLTVNYPWYLFWRYRGANLNQCFLEAVRTGWMSTVEFLLDHDPNVNINFENDEALLIAVRTGNIDMIKFLLKRGAKIKTQENQLVLTAADISGPNGAVIMKELIDAGANIHFTNEAPLKTAIIRNNLGQIKTLVDAGADVNIQMDDPYQKPLWMAIEMGNANIVKILLPYVNNIHFDEDGALRHAIKTGIKKEFSNHEVVKELLIKGADPNTNNQEFLIIAAAAGHWKVLKELINKGGDLNADNGKIILEAIKFNQNITVEFLSQEGAKVSLLSEENQAIVREAMITTLRRLNDETDCVRTGILIKLCQRYFICSNNYAHACLAEPEFWVAGTDWNNKMRCIICRSQLIKTRYVNLGCMN